MNDHYESDTRYLQELGPNLMKIIKRLLANQNLLRLLVYTDHDPLDPNKPDVQPIAAYKHGDDGVIRIVPIIGTKDDSQSIVVLRVAEGLSPDSSPNTDFLDIFFAIEVFVPVKQWVIKGDNLRPYMIMGEIQKSLENKKINGLGAIRGSGFETNFFTQEISAFIMQYRITEYN